MRLTFFQLFLLLALPLFNGKTTAFSQHDDSLYVAYFKKDIEVVDPNFKRNYDYMLRKIKRIYPYAQYAKSLLEDYEKDVQELDKKRQIKKYGKTAHEKLMDDFEYVIRDMYVSDGKVLMKLVYRETGHSVFDIIAKYRGKLKANWYSAVGKLFEQDLKATYNPDKEDWLIERIVKEVESGKHSVNELKLISKDEFKEIKKNDKARSKAAKERIKAIEKAKKEKVKSDRKKK